MKNKPCKHCGSELHLSLKCFKKPVKPPKTAVKVKKAKTPKKKAPTRSQLVKKLDTVYSQYVRLDKSDSNGNVSCVTCGDVMFWKQAQNGHFISRAKYPTRWHDDNCNVQCMRCNVFLKGNYIEYTIYMIDSYGRDYVDELKALSVSGEKMSTPDMKELIEFYKKEVNKLKLEKGVAFL